MQQRGGDGGATSGGAWSSLKFLQYGTAGNCRLVSVVRPLKLVGPMSSYTILSHGYQTFIIGSLQFCSAKRDGMSRWVCWIMSGQSALFGAFVGGGGYGRKGLSHPSEMHNVCRQGHRNTWSVTPISLSKICAKIA